MLYLVTGGAGSGKSAFAEGLITASPHATRVYLATMQGGDGESERRIARHRAMRAGKGFVTLERPRDLAGAPVPEGSAVLLEDLSNLTANEYFSPLGPAGAGERVLAGVAHLCERAALVVVVANELYSDGLAYGGDTAAYLTCLAGLARAIAARADRVYEVVCGLSVCWKGEGA